MDNTVKPYFAYDSTINRGIMRGHNCADIRAVSVATLAQWSLLCNFHLTMIPDDNGSVTGGLWEISRYQGTWLDHAYRVIYRKTDIAVLLPNGEHCDAYTYVRDPFLPTDKWWACPTISYALACVAGAKDWGIDPLPLINSFLAASEQRLTVNDIDASKYVTYYRKLMDDHVKERCV